MKLTLRVYIQCGHQITIGPMRFLLLWKLGILPADIFWNLFLFINEKMFADLDRSLREIVRDCTDWHVNIWPVLMRSLEVTR